MAERLSPNAPIVLIGHDWGADAAYRAAAAHPDRFSQVVTLSIPHPVMIRIRPAFVWEFRHFLTFQRKAYTLKQFRRNDFANVDELYQRWSPI